MPRQLTAYVQMANSINTAAEIFGKLQARLVSEEPGH